MVALYKLFCDFMDSILAASVFNYKPEQKSALETFVPNAVLNINLFFIMQVIIYEGLLETCKDP